jgi:ankyrin repeat protein
MSHKDIKVETNNHEFISINDPDYRMHETTDYPPLHLAVLQDRIEEIEKILEDGVDINCINSENETPLHVGLISGCHISTIEYLLEYGASIKSKTSYGVYPIHLAADLRRGIELIELFLQNGADAGRIDDFGCSALHFASEPEVIKTLIRAGCDVNGKSKMGYTPLHFLLLNEGSIECIEILLNASADCSLKDADGFTPLHYVAKFDFTPHNEKIFRTLLDHGADLHALTSANQSVFDIALDSGNSTIVELIKSLEIL